MPLPSDPQVLATSEALVNQLHTVFGKHAAVRPNHTKGILLKGTFSPSSTSAELSTAPHFNGATTPIIVRFSNSTGIPNIPDNSPMAEPRGIAIRFDLGPHKHTDIVAHGTPFFPVRTGNEFLEMLQAIAASPEGTPSPSPIEQFLGAHPKALEFVTSPKPALASYSEANYFGVNAFKLVSADGKGTFIRYRIVPNAPITSGFSVEGKPEDYLQDEIAKRVLDAPVVLKLLAQVAEEGDITDDATSYWPEERKVVELGTLSVEAVLDDGPKVAKQTIFDPIPRVHGIEPSADPLLEVRAGSYLIAGKQRRAD